MGVGVGLAAGEGDPDGSTDADGAGEIGLADGDGAGVTGAFVAGGAGGLTWARGAAADAMTHPARIAPPKISARAFTRYAILASFRLTAEASSVL